MYCLANMCYLCLENDKLISNINSSESVHSDLVHSLENLPFNLAWLNTLQTILVCEECCLRLRETNQFLEKCGKNIALLRGFVNSVNTSTVSNTENVAELHVRINPTPTDVNEVTCAAQPEHEAINTLQWRPNVAVIGTEFVDFEESLIKAGFICKQEVDDMQDNHSTETIEEAEEVLVNVQDYFVKEEDTWKREVVDDTEECPMDDNSTAGMDNQSNSHDKQDDNTTDFTEEEVLVNTQDYFVKEEDTWKREIVDDAEECPMDNNSTENVNNDPDSEISVNPDAHLTSRDFASSNTNTTADTDNESESETSANPNAHLTDTDCVSPDHDSPAGTDNESDSEKSENSNAHLTDSDSDSSFKRKESYECTICKKTFKQKSHLIIHMRVHTGEKPYNCSRCEKCFGQRPHLVCHMRTHTGEKPYECSECKKCFSTRWILVCHMRTHTGEKSYECSECKKCFAQHSNLVCHMRTHTGEKPYECSECNKCFTRRSDVVRHMRTHTGEKPYECSKCKKCFTVRSNLMLHMRTHTGEKLYECSECKKCFNVRASLVLHMRTHTGEKPFECSECKKCFAQYSNLMRHMRTY